jgi:hypothetical protein
LLTWPARNSPGRSCSPAMCGVSGADLRAARWIPTQDAIECASQVAAKIEERVSLAKDKVQAGEDYEKAVGVLWGISVGEPHPVGQAALWAVYGARTCPWLHVAWTAAHLVCRSHRGHVHR